MRLIGSFYQFTQRVIKAVKAAKLPKDDVTKLERLLNRTAKRNIILAKGILTALNAGGVSNNDIARFSQLLEKANEKISSGKNPFSESDKQEITDIFKRSYLSTKAAHWFSTQMDELVAAEIEEFIRGDRQIGVPSRKTVSFEIKEKPQEKTTTKT